jgi:hypothetical protein
MQRHVAEDVVKDVGLGQVVELLARPYGHRRRKSPQRQATEEILGRYEAGDGHGFPSCGWREPAIHFREIGDSLAFETDNVSALQKDPAAVLPQLAHPPLVKHAPDFVVLRRV